MRRHAVILALLTLLRAGASLQADDSQYRSEYYLKVLDTRVVDLSLWSQVGFSDSAANPNRFMAGPKVSFDPWQHWTFGLNYTFFERQLPQPPGGDWDWQEQHRAEFEVIPHLDLWNWGKLYFRNRLELRWIEGVEDVSPRSRHRLEVVFPLKHAGPVQDLFTQFEYFYDYRKDRNSENRFVPLGVTFKLHDRVAFKAFYMWQPSQADDGWDHSHVFYTQLYVSL